jgi:tight adherence protein C
MSELVLPVAWLALLLAGAARRRPAPARVRALLPPAPSRSRPAWTRDPRVRRWALAVSAGAAGYVVLPVFAPVLAVVAWAVPVVRARRRAGAAAAAVRRSLPEAVDLLNLAVGAGLTVPLAIAAVGRRHQGPVGIELARVAREVDGGRRCADALEDAGGRLGPDAGPVLSALVASERYGAPLAEALARLAADVRADQRRRAEESARRVPVKLLFPLVLCVLPAFALLTVAPLLAGALGSLRL